MKIRGKALAKILPLVLVALALAGPAWAQFSMVEGEVRNLEGKPFVDVVIVFKAKDTGQTVETKTDKNGQFVMNGLRIGTWTLIVKVKGQVAHERDIHVTLNPMEKQVINFKDILAKQSVEESASRKKQEEEVKKSQGMKEHFDAGRAALEQAIAARNEMLKTPAAERGPLTEKLAQTSTAAITEFEAARQAAPEKESQMHIVQYNLGQAYDIAGRYDEAIAAFTAAIEQKGDVAGYFQALGTTQARVGKVVEAMATCDRSAALPGAAAAPDAPSVNAACYSNVGIILQNGARMKESIEPLKKALALNPNAADYWFLLGRALSNAMGSKMEGGKMIAIVEPGTAEAYQKYLELAPTGRFAQDAKDGLEMLKALGVGIDTKVSTKKKKS